MISLWRASYWFCVISPLASAVFACSAAVFKVSSFSFVPAPAPFVRARPKGRMRMDEMDRYRELIKENIDFDLLLTEYPYDEDTLEGYVELMVEGKGIETTARLLQEDGILTPTQYWESKGIRKGGKKSQDTPCKWCKTTITKILTLREYTGTLVNFKTYSKSFKNKRRLDNPEENWAIFENHHEAIIDKTTWEQVQKLREGTKRRKPKNTEKNMFAGLLYCADCGHKLHYNINHPNSSIEYFNCSNYRGNRGTCNETHYIRAGSLEQVVLLELNRMVSYLKNHAEEFAELLAQKTTKDYERESRNRQQHLQELMARNKEVDRLFERIYEDVCCKG